MSHGVNKKAPTIVNPSPKMVFTRFVVLQLVLYVESLKFNSESKWDILISLLYVWSLNSNFQSVVYIPYTVLPESSDKFSGIPQSSICVYIYT